MQCHLGTQLMDVLVGKVSKLDGALDVLANIECGACQMTVLPMDKLVVVGSLVAYLPIQLGHAVVHPAVGIPQQHVGI